MRPTTRRIVFEEVKVKAVFHWRDADGKKRQETKTFMQTLNPFNVNAKTNQPKSRSEIVAELKIERDAWLLKKQNDQRDIEQGATR